MQAIETIRRPQSNALEPVSQPNSRTPLPQTEKRREFQSCSHVKRTPFTCKCSRTRIPTLALFFFLLRIYAKGVV